MKAFFAKPATIKHLLIASVLVLVVSISASGGAATGPAGPRGDQGEQGDAGDTGDTGERGRAGKTGRTGKTAKAPAPSLSSSTTTSGGSTIEDGTWEVGADIAPGTYRAKGGGSCYWEILKGPPKGDNLDNIEENDVASSNVVVTLSHGQWFKTNDCGTWK